jgi:beta-galactosidase
MKTKGEYEYRLRWDDVIYQSGTVKVVAYKNGQVWATEEIHTAGSPAKVLAAVETGHGPEEGFGGDKESSRIGKKQSLSSDGIIFIDAKVADNDDYLVPTADNLLEISIKGPAELVFSDAGDPTSHVSFHSPTLKAFGGLASFGIRKKGNGKAKITITSGDLKKCVFKIRFKEGKAIVKGA